jgi:hypothetical protein
VIKYLLKIIELILGVLIEFSSLGQIPERHRKFFFLAQFQRLQFMLSGSIVCGCDEAPSHHRRA